jgi:hypothetical protein
VIVAASLAAASALAAFDLYWPMRQIEACEERLDVPHPDDPTIRLTGQLDLRFLDLSGRVPRRVLLDWKRVGKRPPKVPRAAAAGAPIVLGDSWATLDVQCHHYSAVLALRGLPVDEAWIFKIQGAPWDTSGAPQDHVVQRLAGTPPTAPAVHLGAVLDRATALRAVASNTEDGRRFGDCFDEPAPCAFRHLCVAERAGDVGGALVALNVLRGGGPDAKRPEVAVPAPSDLFGEDRG